MPGAIGTAIPGLPATAVWLPIHPPLPLVPTRAPTGYGVVVQRNRLYRDGVLEAEDFDPADISERICEPGVVVWLDLESPDSSELAQNSTSKFHAFAEDTSSRREVTLKGTAISRRTGRFTFAAG